MSAKNRKKKYQKMNVPLKEKSDLSRSLKKSINSGTEKTDQLIDQDVRDIIQMRDESLIDSFKSMENVIRYQYRTGILEGFYMLKNEIIIFFNNLRISLWPKLKKYPLTLYQSQINKLQKCLQFTPIPNSFNFASCMVNQYWTIIIIAVKCYGEIFANMSIGFFLLSLLLEKNIPSLIFIYILMPLFAYLLNQKIPLSKISLAERRWIILIFSFWIGASTHFILINWDLGIFPPPPFYSPTLVAFLFELLGPMLAYNRPLLLLNTIGIASCVCFTYAYIYACFTFTYFYTSMIAIASSFYSMQQHLADPKLGFLNFVFFFHF
uniref:Uncharacterized protein n=1 Tax=Onchocerca volvulus TaxID=6282 RepID=A0A8R1TLT6_ONCVO